MPPTQETSPSPPLEQSLKASVKLSRCDLEYLKEWLTKQPHLPPLTETELVPFLHSNDYSLEKTKTCIDKYFTMRTHAPEFFQSFDINKQICKDQLSIHHYVLLPKRDSQGNRIICSEFYNKDATLFDFDATTAVVYAYLDVIIREEPTCPGYVFVLNSGNTTFAHVSKTNVSSLCKSMTYFQQALPLKMKAIHVINVNAVAEACYALAKSFIGEELQQMLQFHSGKMEKFYETIPKDSLPTEFGGTLGSLAEFHETMADKLKERNEWLQQLSQKTVQDNKRPGDAKSAGDVFGMEGSFKKLDID
ncbi:hypothetical protein R5R35_014033 [Gryllus longicercus]|uniref:CRAL-TRIO domain-containing protein n=1 Tax=Gryllus longicercus TaxID=2509291 RepID=A0AAN9VZW0_9ORTH